MEQGNVEAIPYSQVPKMPKHMPTDYTGRVDEALRRSISLFITLKYCVHIYESLEFAISVTYISLLLGMAGS